MGACVSYNSHFNQNVYNKIHFLFFFKIFNWHEDPWWGLGGGDVF